MLLHVNRQSCQMRCKFMEFLDVLSKLLLYVARLQQQQQQRQLLLLLIYV